MLSWIIKFECWYTTGWTRYVLKNIVGFEVDKLPQQYAWELGENTHAEMKRLACQQVAEELSEQANLTLHSDSTSKFGQHYIWIFLGFCWRKCIYTSYRSFWDINRLCWKDSWYLKDDIELVAGKGMCAKLLRNTYRQIDILYKKYQWLESYNFEMLTDVANNFRERSFNRGATTS